MNDSFDIQKLINDFSKVNRSIYLPGTKNQLENDVHHSISVAFLAWQIHDSLNLDLDMSKVMKYAIAHDIVEIYAGDTHAFASQKARQQKKTKEAESLKQISAEFEDIFPDLIAIINEYECRQDDESLFVWTVDKMQPIIQNELTEHRALYDQGIMTSDIVSTTGAILDKAYPPLRPLYSEFYHRLVDSHDDTKVNTLNKPTGNPAARS